MTDVWEVVTVSIIKAIYNGRSKYLWNVRQPHYRRQSSECIPCWTNSGRAHIRTSLFSFCFVSKIRVRLYCKGRFTLHFTSPFRHVKNFCWLYRGRCPRCKFLQRHVIASFRHGLSRRIFSLPKRVEWCPFLTVWTVRSVGSPPGAFCTSVLLT
jgi:hypothetical protein